MVILSSTSPPASRPLTVYGGAFLDDDLTEQKQLTFLLPVPLHYTPVSFQDVTGPCESCSENVIPVNQASSVM